MKSFLAVLVLLAVASFANSSSRRGGRAESRSRYYPEQPRLPRCTQACAIGTYPGRVGSTCACLNCPACPAGASFISGCACACTTALTCAANFVQTLTNCAACTCNIARCLNGAPVNTATCSC